MPTGLSYIKFEYRYAFMRCYYGLRHCRYVMYRQILLTQNFVLPNVEYTLIYHFTVQIVN